MRKLLGYSLLLLLSFSGLAPSQENQPSSVPSAQTPASPSPDRPAQAPASSSNDGPEPESRSPKPDLTPDSKGALSQDQMRALTRIVAENYRTNYKTGRDYTYIEREVQHKLDGNGQIKSTEVQTYEIMALYGEQFQRLIEKDDKPLPEKDAAKEEERIQRELDKRKNETDEERAKRQAEQEKLRQKNREFVSEVANAYDFQLVGSEVLNGHDTWVIAAEPRKDFEPHSKEARMLSKFHGRMWIDKNEMQLVKLDVEAIDTVSIGWVLARIHKGTRFVYEQTRINDEVWLPGHLNWKLNARVALFKGYNQEGEQTYRDYKKFRTAARVVGVGDVQQP
jgi:hypothetical protein